MCEKTTRLNYLNAAINDLSSCIRFMDTKVAAVIAADMLMLTGLIELRCDFINFCNNIKFSCFNIILLIILLCFLGNTIRVYYVGISTLYARIGKMKGKVNTAGNATFSEKKLDERTSWFVSENKENYSIDEYLSDFESKTSDDLQQEMAKELYKLNEINRIKMEKVNLALKAFSWSLLSAGLFLAGIFLSSITDNSIGYSIINEVSLNQTVQKTNISSLDNISQDISSSDI